MDPWFLAHDHHIFMSLGVNNALKNKSDGRAVVVGLGGGGLCSFLRQISPKVAILHELFFVILRTNKFLEIHQTFLLKFLYMFFRPTNQDNVNVFVIRVIKVS